MSDPKKESEFECTNPDCKEHFKAKPPADGTREIVTCPKCGGAGVVAR